MNFLFKICIIIIPIFIIREGGVLCQSGVLTKIPEDRLSIIYEIFSGIGMCPRIGISGPAAALKKEKGGARSRYEIVPAPPKIILQTKAAGEIYPRSQSGVG
jgi:hypothetical protein